ncbi:MAG TPA: ribosome silencing factor [Chlorobiota bacterium]|nr:ribosome silencing factor [Chlorobiota bacterium]
MASYAKPRTSKGRAVLCGRIAQDKLAHDILLLDLSDIEMSPADFFVICTVDSEAQMKAVVDAIDATVKHLGMGIPRTDGRAKSTWVVLDYFDIVIHVMLPAAREFYKLERLWGDAKAYTLTPAGAAKSVVLGKKGALE